MGEGVPCDPPPPRIIFKINKKTTPTLFKFTAHPAPHMCKVINYCTLIMCNNQQSRQNSMFRTMTVAFIYLLATFWFLFQLHSCFRWEDTDFDVSIKQQLIQCRSIRAWQPSGLGSGLVKARVGGSNPNIGITFLFPIAFIHYHM